MSKFILIAMIFTQAVVFAQTSKTFTSDFGDELMIVSKTGQPVANEFAVVEFSIKNLTSFLSDNKFFLEVQPLRDCYDDVNSEIYGDIITIEVSEDIKKSKNIRISLELVQRKCFNWRVVVSSQNSGSETSTSKTNWQFSPFVF